MHKIPCRNCKGQGSISHFKHVENGICFKCSGSGLQEVSKEEYSDYIQNKEREAKGKYILSNNGIIEYYKSIKEITNVYGNFFTGEYGNYSVHINYNDKNIVYTNHTGKSDKFIEAAQKEYNKRIQEKVNKYKEMLIEETDQEWIEIVNNKISELKGLLK